MKGTPLHATGSVVDVIEGKAPDEDAWIDLAEFQAGFEAASPDGVDGIGEFVSFNGVGYVKSTRPGKGYYELVYGPKIVTNGAVFLHRDAVRSFRMVLDEPTPLVEVYEQMHARTGAPLCFTGTAIWQRYYGTAISKAPVYGENIFEVEGYYSQPKVDLEETPAAIMGCVADLSAVDPSTRDHLGAVLYYNPVDPPKAGSLVTHSHTLRLDRAITEVGEITPDHAVDVHHLYQDSVVRSAVLDVFLIDGFVPL